MYEIELGIIILESDRHLKNAHVPMFVTESGISISERLIHP